MTNAAQNLTPPPVRVDACSRTIQPLAVDGDEYFGLSAGSNGTAAITRRSLLEAIQPATGPFTWVRSNGRPAVGITFVPTARSDDHNVNPWAG